MLLCGLQNFTMYILLVLRLESQWTLLLVGAIYFNPNSGLSYHLLGSICLMITMLPFLVRMMKMVLPQTLGINSAGYMYHTLNRPSLVLHLLRWRMNLGCPTSYLFSLEMNMCVLK
uniref:Uncharacterized protein n=1 Tax=Opuntia streptacantha TaxID=393608 RepID=A0A7C9DUM3_OPUST